jgi:hypothetical protein
VLENEFVPIFTEIKEGIAPIKERSGAEGVVQAIEHLPSNCESLSSNPCATKRKKGGERKKERRKEKGRRKKGKS